MASIISAGTTSGTSLNLSGDTSGVLQLASNGSTTAVTINTSQNVGIGTASPATRLDVRCVSDVTQDIAYFSRPDAAVRAKIALDGSGIINFGTSTNHPLAFLTNNTEQARITSAGLLQFNSGYGSVATAYGCRAWVNFNGTGTVAIRGSGNVSSITDRGTGEYTLNFTTALPDANYCGVASATIGGSGNSNRSAAVGPTNTSSAYCNSWIDDSGAFADVDVICAAIFR